MTGALSLALAVASSALLGAALLVAVCNLLTAERLERAGEPLAHPRVSLLVPARDEAANLARTLPALLALDYPDLEILVLDDGSEDGTPALVAAATPASAGRLRLLHGEPLPPGWLGKNWACHQLAAAARGEILLFCDADVSPRPEAVSRTVALLQRSAADALTALPRQRYHGSAEESVIPLVAQLPVVALLPLRLVTALAAPALSMANGQWLAVARGAYERSGGHEAVRAEVVEDVALARRLKRAGSRLVPAVASRAIEVRMYADAAEMRAGFGKNLYPLAGGRPLPFAAALLGFLLVAVYPWAAVAVGSFAAFLPLGLLLALRVVAVLLLGHGWRSVLLHPRGSILVVGLALHSFRLTRSGGARWKGRPLPSHSARGLT